MDQEKVQEFLGRFVADLGATGSAGQVAVGHRLGIYAALADGPATPEELAERTGYAARYLREWLLGQAAGGYVTYDGGTGRFHLTPEQAFCLADPNGPNVAAAFVAILGYLKALPRVADAFRTGAGIAWGEHDEDVFVGVDAFYRPGYVANLVPSWIPALDGVAERLAAGARVADVGAGLGSSTVLMARAFPRSAFVGIDAHATSVELARKNAAEAGVTDRVTFEVTTAQAFGGGPYDLVTMFDALHDMGDPVGALRRARANLSPDGTVMLVEPAGWDTVEESLNPVGRLYYAGSTFLCVPNALAQDGGYALGALAGPSATRAVAEEAGFTRVRVAARTPFNTVYELRP